MIQWLRQHLARESGSYAVEFSVIAPLAIAIIAFGMSVFLGLSRQAQLERVAEIAARAASVPSAYSDAGSAFRTEAEILDAVERSTTGVVSSLTYLDADGNVIADPQVLEGGQTFSVIATAIWPNPFVRFVNLLGTGVVGDVDTLRARATGVRE